MCSVIFLNVQSFLQLYDKELLYLLKQLDLTKIEKKKREITSKNNATVNHTIESEE